MASFAPSRVALATGAALAVAVVSVALRLPERLPLPVAQLTWQILTGSVLLGLYIFQWRVFLDRWMGRGGRSEAHVVTHRWVGAAMLLLFAVHALKLGYGLSLVLAVVFLANGLVGLMSRREIPLRGPNQVLVWTFVHVALSASLLPLIALHVWVALSFE